MKTPLFSVIIPALNEEEFIVGLLSDLSKQSDKNFEVIVVDGKSEDRTKEVALSYSNKLSIRVIEAEMRNISFQRNEGANVAEGKYLVVLDADVRVGKNFIKHLSKEVSNSKYLIYLPSSVPESDDYGDIALFKVINFCIELSQNFSRPTPMGSAMIFEKNFFLHLGGFTVKDHKKGFFPEDHDLMIRAANSGVHAKFLRSVKITFSFRRIKKEGHLKTYMKYLQSAIRMSLKGKVSQEEMFHYEMGGHVFKDEDEK